MGMHSSWINPKLEVRKSKIHQKGVFAREKIPAGERVAIFGGQIMLIDEIDALPENLQDYPMQIEERFVIGTRTHADAEETDYFNHSCDPNCGFKGQIFLVAMRDIEPNTEVTFDYAMVLSKSVGSEIAFEMDCTCGSKKCRQRITEEDWKLPKLRQKYRGHFSQYLEDRMDQDRAGPVDFMRLTEGDLEPSLNKRIDTLIEATESYVVYLDEELFVEWSVDDPEGEDSDSFGEISNGVALLESLSISLLSRRHMKPFRRLLGESMARSLEGADGEARHVLKLARGYLDARSTERARLWYLTSASITTALFLLLVFVSWLLRERIDTSTLAFLLSTPFGALGALISIIRRTSVLGINAAAGPTIHYVEGAARVVVGVGGAFLLSLAVKANMLLGFSQTLNGESYLFLTAICIIAGASEMILPNLIQKVEGSI